MIILYLEPFVYCLTNYLQTVIGVDLANHHKIHFSLKWHTTMLPISLAMDQYHLVEIARNVY